MNNMLENVGTLLIGIFTSAGVFMGSLLAYKKWGPEVKKLKVETVDVNVNMASELRDDAWNSFDRVRAEMLRMQAQIEIDRAEMLQYRQDTEKRMLELATEVRAEKAHRKAVQAENTIVVQENTDLRTRVAHLEQEVASLKAYNTRSPHEYDNKS